LVGIGIKWNVIAPWSLFPNVDISLTQFASHMADLDYGEIRLFAGNYELSIMDGLNPSSWAIV